MATCLELTLREDWLDDNVTAGTSSGYKRFFLRFDSVTTTDVAAVATLGGLKIPQPGDAYSPTRPNCVLSDRKPVRIKGTMFSVECKYSDPTLGQFPADLLELPATIDEDDETWNEEYTIDASDDGNGNPQQVKNTAGEPFDRGPERLVGDTVFIVTKYVTAATRAAIRDDKRTVNPGSMNIEGLDDEENHFFLENCRFEGLASDTDVFKATLKIVHRDGGFVDRIPSYGFHELDDADKTVPIYETADSITIPAVVNPDGTETQATQKMLPAVLTAKPWPLDEYGKAQANPTDDAFVMEFYPYREGGWGWLDTVLN